MAVAWERLAEFVESPAILALKQPKDGDQTQQLIGVVRVMVTTDIGWSMPLRHLIRSFLAKADIG